MFNKITIVLALSLAGCQSASETPQQPFTDNTASAKSGATSEGLAMPSPIATIEIGSNYGKDGIAASALARVTGELSLRDNCLVVVSADGRALQPVFGKNTANWDAKRQQLEYNKRRYKMGGTIVLGGGLVSFTRASLPHNWNVPMCRDADMFAVSG